MVGYTQQSENIEAAQENNMDAKKQGAEVMFALSDRIRIADPAARKRVIEITCQMVESMVLKGEINPDNAEELKKATRQCARDAWEAYRAAEEFLSG